MATGFSYVPVRRFSPLPPPSYEAVRQFRPYVIETLKAANLSNQMFFNAIGDGEPMCVVYAAINRDNNKIYVGATEVGVQARAKRHFLNATSGRPGLFNSAIRKHGRDSFEFVIVAHCQNFFDALEKERNAIASIMPEYNLTSGGGGIKGYKFTPEQIERGVSKRRGRPSNKRGVPLSVDQRKLVSDGVKKWWKDHGDLSDQERTVLLANAKLANVARRRAVVCIDDGKNFASVTEAATFYGINCGQVSYSCNNADHKPRKIPKFRYALQ